VATGRERLDADAVVIASGSDAALLREGGADLPLVPIKAEMVRRLPVGPLAGPIVFAPGGYLVPKANGSLLMGATQLPDRYDLGVAAGAVATLLEFARRVVPQLAEARFVEAWDGLRPGLPDRLPAIGPVPAAERALGGGRPSPQRDPAGGVDRGAAGGGARGRPGAARARPPEPLPEPDRWVTGIRARGPRSGAGGP
jgi:glycine/D-amino acid oxidase-like deaminating enzyme